MDDGMGHTAVILRELNERMRPADGMFLTLTILFTIVFAWMEWMPAS